MSGAPTFALPAAQVIGNKHKKLDYISAGAIARVVELLSGETDAGILVQAAATLGSFACGGNVAAVLKHGAFEHLVQALSHADEKVVESAVRSIKFIYQVCP